MARNTHFLPPSIKQLTGQHSRKNVGLYQSRGNPHDPICWKLSKMAHPFAWKMRKNIIFWIFWVFETPIFMKISIYWPSMVINIDSLCLEYLSNLSRDQEYALSYWGWPKIVLDRPKFEPQTTLLLLDLIRFQ